MQDNWQDFDRQIQSVLQDASEKVPGRVWRAVSARLDSAAKAALWWRWAVPAFVAAALLAGLFFTGTMDRKGAGDINIIAEAENSVSGGSVSQEALALADAASADMFAPLAERPEASRIRRSGPVREILVSEPQQAMEEQVSSSEQVASAGQHASDPAGDKSASGQYESGDNTDIAAQWAMIEHEEKVHSRARVQMHGLYAQGSVGGNDSNIRYGGGVISRLAPGAGSADAGISENGQSTYGVPFTLGLGVRFKVTDKLSFGTGLDYSLLTRTFSGSYTGSAAAPYDGLIQHNLNYLGVPLNVYYNLLGSRDELFKLYAWGGGEAEYCLTNRYRLLDAQSVISDKAGGFQFSAALGLGLEFKLSNALGLYVDPSVRYYFHTGQPKSIRTDKPFMFNFDAGLRFNF